MEGVTLHRQPSVLIVDRSEETREVLQIALQRRGVRTLAADRARAGLELARRYHPDLIVLDLEVDGSGPEALCAPFLEQSHGGRPALVMLGAMRRTDSQPLDGRVVPKPYHYGPLIRTIEAVLDGRSGATPCRHCS